MSIVVGISSLVIQNHSQLKRDVKSISAETPIPHGWDVTHAIYSGKKEDVNYGYVLTGIDFFSRGSPSELEVEFTI